MALGRGLASLIAAVLVMPSPIVAAVTGNWGAVRGLERGRRIQVVLKKAEIAWQRDVVKGRFASAADDQVKVQASGGNSSTLAKDAIEQIRISSSEPEPQAPDVRVPDRRSGNGFGTRLSGRACRSGGWILLDLWLFVPVPRP